MTEPQHLPLACSRRDFLFRAGSGFGGLALATMLAEEGALGQSSPLAHPAPRSPLAPKPPQFRARAKSVIFLFMVGGPSHVETFDPKPELDRMDGEPLPASFGVIKSQFTNGGTPLMRSAWKFHKRGRSGIEVSELLPNIAECADDLAIIRSCYTESFVHAPAMYQMVSGRTVTGHPSAGSWVAYGLGSESENLPAYCVLPQPQGLPEGGAPMWDSGYLPAIYQGTVLHGGDRPIFNLQPPPGMTRAEQRRMLDYLKEMNERTVGPDGSDLSARIAAYELAFRMQLHAPEAVDIRNETAETLSLYGIDSPHSSEFGTRCLLARRLVERGVRFVQLFSGGGPVSWQWDAHDNVVQNHEKMCAATDQPIAGLLKDLKRRGLLDETLVVWGSEFGRTPVSQNGKGRDHNPKGFTIWMAGGGIRGGVVHGATDEIGYRAMVDPVHARDIHATILHQLGIDHKALTYLHNGRNERLTDFAGEVITPITS
ncbi:MAG TPA: DUF1501 domain-containing protein [Chthonomonadaceae bacterium]|nr:DUF1501 domain-containing protein [Chthonomonadaceae bacterium]